MAGSRLFTFMLACGLACSMPLLAAGPAPEKSIGQQEYEAKCVMCHGASGKGNGWFAPLLKTPPASITELKRRNGGVFPFEHVYEVIDGRKEVLAHGRRDMPVWGGVYRAESTREYPPYGEIYADEGLVRGRILALIEYVSRLQE